MKITRKCTYTLELEQDEMKLLEDSVDSYIHVVQHSSEDEQTLERLSDLLELGGGDVW
jgi:hypothetical protein